MVNSLTDLEIIDRIEKSNEKVYNVVNLTNKELTEMINRIDKKLDKFIEKQARLEGAVKYIMPSLILFSSIMTYLLTVHFQ